MGPSMIIEGPLGSHTATAIVLAVVLSCGGMAGAATGEECWQLRQERDGVATASMEQELALARAIRKRLCPELSARAEVANARDGRFTPIDYGALGRCRLEAERQLEAGHPVLYRNSQGFTFYTAAGAALARQADQRLTVLKARSCL